MDSGGGRSRGRGGQHFDPAYDSYGGGGSRGGGRGRGRRHRRRRGHGATRQGGRGGFLPAHLGQNHGQGNGQEHYDQEGYDEEGYDEEGYDEEGYDEEGYDEEYYGQEGYYGSQYEGQGDWQYDHDSGERWYENALYRSEMEASDLRERLWQCEEALRSKREEVGALCRTLAENDEAHMAELEREFQNGKEILEADHGLRKDLEDRDQIIAQKSDEIQSAIAERDSIKRELEAWKQIHCNLRSDSDRIIEDLKRKEGEAKNDVVQARTALQLANEKVAEQRAEIEAGRESSNAEIQSVKRELLCAKEGAREQDRLISQKDARIEALERRLEDHNDMMPLSNTQGVTALPESEVELLAHTREPVEAHDAIARWKDLFRFVEDDAFNDARTMEHVGAILNEVLPRARLYDFLMEGHLNTWLCLSCVTEPRYTISSNLCCRAPDGRGIPCQAVMVTVIDSVRRLRFLKQTV